MSTTTLYAALAATLIATGWLLPMGVIRMLAYRSGEVDHTKGMRNIAILALTLGIVSAVACLSLAAVVASR
ncbi:hypothetical protein H1W00_13815 [Aeromicrobium sp. Marseille-Q0843]|uniref:Uncharacterized protein n=1 Tax=Aeromicrobium phoceense TaxID=2754045 RepID=A0A838XLA3_9ACTN|nr:hypothetical protein [Aeromicrobium phoceense]MBA4609558.1 hypothetical protein [Aeromicrobium phoceense]